jgi:hypothetical protein
MCTDRVFAIVSHFHPSLIFGVVVERPFLKWSPQVRQVPAFPANIRQMCKKSTFTNAPAYDIIELITAVKSFRSMRPSDKVIKIFLFVGQNFLRS